MKAYSNAAVRRAVGAGGLAIALMGCGTEQPQSTVSRELVSGVTSSNGGGMVPGNFSTFAPTAVSGVSFDTGNMAYPDPLPQGNLGTTRVR